MKAILSSGETCLEADNQERLMQMVRYVRGLRDATDDSKLKEGYTNILAFAILIEQP